MQNDGDVDMDDWEDHLDDEGVVIIDLDDDQVYAGEWN